jgi:hypothetical protein
VDPAGLEVSSTSDRNGLTGRTFTRAELAQAAATYNGDPFTTPDSKEQS